VTNGIGARAQISIGGFSAGSHTVQLTDPPGCFSPIVVNCAVSEKTDNEWTDDLRSTQSPTSTSLIGNYPNPFNPSTSISYALNKDSWVTLRVYNTLGQEVATLVNGFQSAGYNSVTWHGTDELGEVVSSGIYFVRMMTGDIVSTQKMMFAK